MALEKQRLHAAKERIKELEAEVDRLREALRFQDPRNANERYEVIARDFNRETGYFAPGKSMPPSMWLTAAEEEQRESLWRPFVNRWHEQWFDAVLAAPPQPSEDKQ